MEEKMICERCWCPIIWYYFGWKHHPGPGRKSCGKPPKPIPAKVLENPVGFSPTTSR